MHTKVFLLTIKTISMIILKVNLVLCKQEKVKKLKGNKGRNHQVKWYVVGEDSSNSDIANKWRRYILFTNENS